MQEENEVAATPQGEKKENEKDYFFKNGFLYPSLEEITLRRLTPQGRAKLEASRQELFGNPETPRYKVPIGKTELHEGDIVEIDSQLTKAQTRKKRGGYFCVFTDTPVGFHEPMNASIKQIDGDKVTLIFEKWPVEFLETGYVTEEKGPKPENLQILNDPITIGPEVVVSLNSLAKNRPNEDFKGWVSNLVNRNLRGKKR